MNQTETTLTRAAIMATVRRLAFDITDQTDTIAKRCAIIAAAINDNGGRALDGRDRVWILAINPAIRGGDWLPCGWELVQTDKGDRFIHPFRATERLRQTRALHANWSAALTESP